MVIKIEGKQHKKGISQKNGNSYDFIIVHTLMKVPYVEGLAAVTKNISVDLIAYDRLIVGSYYDFQTDFNGNVTSVTPAKV